MWNFQERKIIMPWISSSRIILTEYAPSEISGKTNLFSRRGGRKREGVQWQSGLVTHACNPSTQYSGGWSREFLWVLGQCGLYCETPCFKNPNIHTHTHMEGLEEANNELAISLLLTKVGHHSPKEMEVPTSMSGWKWLKTRKWRQFLKTVNPFNELHHEAELSTIWLDTDPSMGELASTLRVRNWGLMGVLSNGQGPLESLRMHFGFIGKTSLSKGMWPSYNYEQ